MQFVETMVAAGFDREQKWYKWIETCRARAASTVMRL